jgi:hypothetical protein
MQRHIGVRRIRVQALPRHQHRLLVRISALPEHRNVGREREISLHLFPDKLECVRRSPHVLAAAADGVRALRSIIHDGPRMQNSADVRVIRKQPHGLSRPRQAGRHQHARKSPVHRKTPPPAIVGQDAILRPIANRPAGRKPGLRRFHRQFGKNLTVFFRKQSS